MGKNPVLTFYGIGAGFSFAILNIAIFVENVCELAYSDSEGTYTEYRNHLTNVCLDLSGKLNYAMQKYCVFIDEELYTEINKCTRNNMIIYHALIFLPVKETSPKTAPFTEIQKNQ